MRNLAFTSSYAALALACCASAAYAQETTSAIRGIVTASGQPVAGAPVEILHTASGTTVNAETDNAGNFVASGLRPGGPFTVKIAPAGRAPFEVGGLFLTAGQPLRLPVEIDPVETVEVTGNRQRDATQLSSGPITLFDQNDIAGVASVKRDLRDIAKRDPLATINPLTNGISIAGQNARNNRFSVDGQRFNDTLGLNEGGLPTSRGPIPIDAIEQLTVKVSPSDITEGDLQGGAINVVLKSGTNDFHGSAFYTYTGDALTGSKSRGTKLALNFSSKNWGANLAGPIVKDKLFFAFTYEALSQFTPASFGLAGAPNVIPNLTQTQVDLLGTILKNVYNYDSLGVYRGFKETDAKYVGKVDWNITDGQRFAVTYIRNENTQKSPGGGNASTTTPSLLLGSNVSVIPQTVDSVVTQVTSDWTSGLQTELRGSYRNYLAPKRPNGEKGFAQFTTCLDPVSSNNPINCISGTPGVRDNASLVAGTLSSIQVGNSSGLQANTNFIKNYGADALVRYDIGSHAIKLNAAFNRNKVGNFFVPNSLGVYYFDSLADLQARRASSLSTQGSITGDLWDATGNFAYDQFTFGLQDSWEVTPDLNVTYGVRADVFGNSPKPLYNQYFAQRYGFANTATYGGRSVVQPRLGVNWKPTPPLTIRASAGLFSGGTPDVFLGRSYTDAGVVNNSIVIQRLAAGGCNVAAALCSAALDNVDGRNFNPAVLEYLRTNIGSISLAATSALDPNFKITSIWKASLSADYDLSDWNEFGEGLRIGGDLYFGKTNHQSIYKDLRAVQIGTTPDGRPRYSSAVANYDLLLTNTSKGRSLAAVARVTKSWMNGFSAGASYAFQDVKELASMVGTTAADNYSNTAAFDTNSSAYGTSAYQIRHDIKVNVDYDRAFFGDNHTRISLWAEWRSGLPFSLTMRDPSTLNNRSVVFGTVGGATRALLYVPDMTSMTSDPIVTYDSQATFDALKAYVGAKGLKQGVVKKNNQRAPSLFKIDLHAEQEVPVPYVEEARVRLFVDIENLLNMLNSKWGAYRTVATNSPVVSVACVAAGANPCAQYRYSAFTNPTETNQARLSVWAVRVGAKIAF